MQGAFIQSLTYNPPSLLGRRLLPFSSWHGLILEAAGSPFICVGTPKIDDLIFGVWVCSHNFEDGFQAASDACAARKWGQKNRKYVRSGLIGSEIDVFQEYIDASFSMPKYWEKGGGETIRAPYWWHCAVFAMRELGLSEGPAWDYPITRIACAQACVAEVNGNKDLLTEADIKGLAILQENK